MGQLRQRIGGKGFLLLILELLAAGVGPAFTNGSQASTTSSSPPDLPNLASYLEKLEEWTLEGVNYERAIRGLRPLELDLTLAHVAKMHSRDMVERNFFGHINPDGQDLRERLQMNGVHRWRMAGENLALNNDPLVPAISAIDAWMMSPGHKQNILTEQFQYTGIGVAQGSNGVFYFTQIFLYR